jgi:hypothetical protein
MTNGREVLRLEFLATGTWQHVFVEGRDRERAWVYKIPAAFGRLLPFGHPQRFRPGVLALVEFVCAGGLSDLLLPCEVLRDAEAELFIDGRSTAYRGHVLKQRRADRLFERNENLRALDWGELVEAHHRLWRHGVTFESTTAVLGLKNWALFEGRLRLFDTSSLTCDPRRVSRALAPEELDRRERWAREKQAAGGDSSEPLVEFLRFIRREINRGKLEQLWRADLRG